MTPWRRITSHPIIYNKMSLSSFLFLLLLFLGSNRTPTVSSFSLISQLTTRPTKTMILQRQATTTKMMMMIHRSTMIDDSSSKKSTTTLFSSSSSLSIEDPDVENDMLDDFLEDEESNELWPSGISEHDIDELVNDCLSDPSINLLGIPDVLERQVYKITIKVTLNALYRLLGKLHGARLLGHEFALERLDRTRKDGYKERRLSEIRDQVREDVLEEVVDKLLTNKAINQPLIPDALERQLYINCLKIIFRLINMIAATCYVTVCGHEIHLTVEGAQSEDALQRVASSHTQIDTQRIMDRVTKRAAMKEEEEELKQQQQQEEAAGGKDNDGDVDGESSPTTSKKKGIIAGAKQDFNIQLKVTVYALILGIVDDLLANTHAELLSDEIKFDIIPSTTTTTSSDNKKPRKERNSKTTLSSLTTTTTVTSTKNKRSKRRPTLKQVVTFVVGVSVGLLLR